MIIWNRQIDGVSCRCHLANRPLGQPGDVREYVVQVYAGDRFIAEEVFSGSDKIESCLAFRQAIECAYDWLDNLGGPLDETPDPVRPESGPTGA